ncbi:MAG TPA: hypothetical protein VJG66_03550 [Patescibacteria group bacterium]|nr:hypothetical protein [Patescibacteria group bacterium]
MPKIGVDRVETFACGGAGGKAFYKPRILLQILNKGDAAARCSYRLDVDYGTENYSVPIFYCTAEFRGPGEKLPLEGVVNMAKERTAEMTEPRKRLSRVGEIINSYYPECPFQGTWVNP